MQKQQIGVIPCPLQVENNPGPWVIQESRTWQDATTASRCRAEEQKGRRWGCELASGRQRAVIQG